MCISFPFPVGDHTGFYYVNCLLEDRVLSTNKQTHPSDQFWLFHCFVVHKIHRNLFADFLNFKCVFLVMSLSNWHDLILNAFSLITFVVTRHVVFSYAKFIMNWTTELKRTLFSYMMIMSHKSLTQSFRVRWSLTMMSHHQILFGLIYYFLHEATVKKLKLKINLNLKTNFVFSLSLVSQIFIVNRSRWRMKRRVFHFTGMLL